MSINRSSEPEVLLTPAEVAKLFRVDPKTVTRWAKAGKLTAIRTLGGHRRYRRSEVQGKGIRNNNIAGGPKLSGGEASGKTPKMFRRKSGSA